MGTLRDLDTAVSMALALSAGPSQKTGPNWTWVGVDDQRSFAELEQERLLKLLSPRGRHTVTTLGSLLVNERVEKADRPSQDANQTAAFLFIPEYAGSRVTADLAEQTVKPKAVFRMAVEPAKANPRFLVQLLNSPYGRQLRASAAQGATIQRTSAASLLSLQFPVPQIAVQDQIARIGSDIGLPAPAGPRHLDTSGRAMFQMMGVFAEFERAMIRERVRSGLARARDEGVKLGRKRIEEADAKKARAIGVALAAKTGVRRIARELGVGVGTVIRIRDAAVTAR